MIVKKEIELEKYKSLANQLSKEIEDLKKQLKDKSK